MKTRVLFVVAVLALVGTAWEPVGRFGTMALLVPALWFATLPTAYAWQAAGGWLRRHTGCPWATATCLAVGAGLVVWAGSASIFTTAKSVASTQILQRYRNLFLVRGETLST